MPLRQKRRVLPVTFSFWKLAFSVAIGVWLGGLAFVFSCGLLYKAYMNQQFPVLAGNAASSSEAARDDANQQMFEQYQRNQQQAQERTGPDTPTCQFWQEQNRNAPSAKARDNLQRYCAP